MKVKIGKGILNVDVRGRGELVILHPAASRSSRDFDLLVKDLEGEGYMTAAINSRGVNGSNGNTQGMTLKDLAGDIADVIRGLDVGPAHVIGHALGGHVVRVLAEQWPDLVRSVICVTIGGIILAKIDPLWAVEYILSRDPSDRERQFAIKMSFFANASDPSPWFNGWNNGVLRDYMLTLATMPEHELLKWGKVPMLVVQGKEDKIAPLETGQLIKERFGECVQIENISKAGHQILTEQPKRLASIVLDFLSQQKSDSYKSKSKRKIKKESVFEKISFVVKNWHLRKYKDIALAMASAMNAPDVSEKGEGKYNLGWGSAITKHQTSRKASQYAVNFLPYLKPGMKLLDCGCGPGSLTIDFAEIVTPGEAVGIDFQPHQIELAHSLAARRKVGNIRFEVGNIYDLPFKDNEFDAAWLCTVVMHLERPMEALKEVYRVLKPGGVIAITDGDWQGDIIYPTFRVINEFSAFFEKRFNKKGMNTHRARSNRYLLREAGFKRVKGSAVMEYYGTSEETQAYTEFIIELARQHVDSRVTEFRIKMVESVWRAWGA